MKTLLFSLAVGLLLVSCDADVHVPPAGDGDKTTIVNPPAENKTTVVNPPAEKKTETNTTIVTPPAEKKD